MMQDPEQVRLRVTVSGRVQGVGFRYYSFRLARRHRLTGLVSNNSDGSVSLEVVGTRESLDAFVASVRIGPALARVDSVKVEWSDLGAGDELYADFEVR